MPAMLRPRGKARKIAFDLLGKPDNMTERKSRKRSRVNQRLLFEETSRVR